MIEIKNNRVLDWVKECADLTNPKEIVWIDGSEEQLESIRSEACATGEMIKLNQEKLPGCYYYRTHPKDVARDEKRTCLLYTSKSRLSLRERKSYAHLSQKLIYRSHH